METGYQVLRESLARYQAGELTSETVKPLLAPYGIYQQRNGLFMARVRVSGGEVDCRILNGLADILDAAGGSAHLTTRQDIQLHDLSADRVAGAVLACDRLGLPFKGGGGNTYRNLVVGPESGLAPESVFDVYPYARAVNRAVLACDKAFALPRKFKIGFFAEAGGTLRAAVQDLGFVARARGGERGFAVYAGGGLGRQSAVGVCLSEFLPAQQAVRAALAAVALFHAHGDRDNRHKARLRFVLQRLGREAFARLFWEFFDATEGPAEPVSETDETRLPPDFSARQLGAAEAAGLPPEEGFAQWSRFAVAPTRFGDAVRSVRLFVPYGKLLAAQLRKIAALAEDAGSPFVRLLATQDILIPFVWEPELPHLYRRLRQELAEIDLTFASYRGHLVTCVGATVCRIGMADTPAVGDVIAAELDRYLPPDTPEKLSLLKVLANEVRLSGCPNACAGHPAAQLGVECVKRREGDAVETLGVLFAGAGVDAAGQVRLSERLPGEPVPLTQLAQRLLEWGKQ